MRQMHGGYSQFFKINNLSCNPSHFFPGQIKEERGGGSVRENLYRFFFSCQYVKKTHLEIRQANPN